MNGSTDVDLDTQLLRRLAGELPPELARALDRRLAAEPELAARYRALEASWAALAPPPGSPVPPRITARVMAAWRPLRGTAAVGPPAALSWSLAPTWVRAAAAFALAAGVALGAGLGHRQEAASDLPPTAPGIGISAPESLATSYWTAIEDATETPSADAAPSGARP
jgi:anti-sigma factor RsiW